LDCFKYFPQKTVVVNVQYFVVAGMKVFVGTGESIEHLLIPYITQPL
jgi:hypothetical protein